MTLTVKELYVDGVQLPTPALEGLTITDNKVWSANTGRLENSGDMAGTIVSIKKKLEIRWPPLSMEDVKRIRSVVSNLKAFHEIKYTDADGEINELIVYFGDPQFTPYAYSVGIQRVISATVSAIEK